MACTEKVTGCWARGTWIMIYDFHARKTKKKKEVFDANVGSLNKILGDWSCLNGFRCFSISSKQKV